MKKLSIFLVVSFVIGVCFAQTRGTTQREIDCQNIISGRLLPISGPDAQHSDIKPQNSISIPKDDWILVDSLKINTILRAGSLYGVQYHATTQTILPCSNLGVLTPSAVYAINKSPDWIKPDLENVLNQLSADKQNDLAAVINAAADPYIDEIAFSIAHSSVEYLGSDYSDVSLFLENALKLYQIDIDLPYVQIVDYGTSTSNPDYYSTTSYQKRNLDGTISSVEVPRDLYYWYIVHPKLSDEIPAYIDPAIVESNTSHTNNISPPPGGQFWRSFFYDVQEGTYPVLSDTLAQCQTMFNRNGVPGDAIKAIQSWINATMNFNSNAERPHQPVRIYQKHMGRCGEYADYTAAAARTALIPCTEVLSASTDHTWNEFWESGWIQWEPVNNSINEPLVYENGWGKVFGSVFEIRSDGFLTNVTERYSAGSSTIQINVTDSLGIPVDGARLIVATLEGTANRFDTVVFTDNNGDVSFTVGDSRQYSVRVESSVGNYPQPTGTYALITESSVAGQNYNFQIELPYAKLQPLITPIPAPSDSEQDWRIAVMFEVPRQILSGVVSWDDIDAVGSPARFYKDVNQTGKVNLLMTNWDNYDFYYFGDFADAFNTLLNVPSGVSVFNLPVLNDWYAFVDNSSSVANAQYVSGAIRYEHYGVGNADDTITPDLTTLLPISPNPFRSETNLRFSLAKETDVTLSIYNIKGQKVKILLNGKGKSGINSLTWNGTDMQGKPVGTGIYYLSLTEGKQSAIRKMLLIK